MPRFSGRCAGHGKVGAPCVVDADSEDRQKDWEKSAFGRFFHIGLRICGRFARTAGTFRTGELRATAGSASFPLQYGHFGSGAQWVRDRLSRGNARALPRPTDPT